MADEQEEDPEIKEVLHSIDDKLGELVNPSPIATYPKKPEEKEDRK